MAKRTRHERSRRKPLTRCELLARSGGGGESLALNTVRLGGFRQGPGMRRVRAVRAVTAP